MTALENRERLLNRLDYLAQITNLLPLHFTVTDKASKDWIQEHFRQIARYVSKREQWIAAPTETTWDTLRQNVCMLGEYYITGDYGKFTEYVEESTQEPDAETDAHRQRRVLYERLRQTASIVIPIVLLVLVQQVPFPGKVLGLFDPGVVSLLLISWLLLAVDAALHLGLVTGVTGLAQNLRSFK